MSALPWAWTRLVLIFIALYWLMIAWIWPQYAVITPVALVAAAFANATAVGGGFLFFPLFIYAFGLLPEQALKLSLSTQAFGMTSGALGWSRRYIDSNGFVTGSVFGGLGVVLGSYYLPLPPELIKPFFGWLSLLVFIVIIAEMQLGRSADNICAPFGINATQLGLCVVALSGGLITAWAAIAAGEFIALYLLLCYRLSFVRAVATGVAVLAACSLVGFVCHVELGGIPWVYLLFTVPGVLVGGALGAVIGRRASSSYKKEQPLRPKIAVVGHSRLPSAVTNILVTEGAALKCLFSIVVLLDGAGILLHHYWLG